MNTILSENTFETAIIDSLCKNGGYQEGSNEGYSPDLGFFKDEVLSFLKNSQPKAWEKLAAVHGDDLENRLLQRLYKEMDLRGCLDVIRNGITDYGVRFKLAFFAPASGLNPETLALYEQNRLSVTRQVYYSKKNRNSVDLVLSVNGLPVATIELKNQFTGQSTKDAQKQYKTSRDNKEILFRFKKRALVHFAVDDAEVFMTTRLDGARTYWLPFNKGYNKGKGNPPNPDGYRTAFLWQQIFARDSWLDIIGRFIHLEVKDYEFEGRIRKKETMIFPRYHQLDAVRKMTNHARANGAGHNYLVQHSAGSGKSNSIAWLSYQLSGLHNAANERIFDSVIVVTDRKVLDSQLQKTIYQFEHTSGVVQRIDKDSTQLAAALQGGTNIIITTLQKFPFVVEKVGDLPGRSYAVVIDEAHSSQGGKASNKLKEVLAASSLEEAGAVESDEGENVSADDIAAAQIEKSAKVRGKQVNLSFFAFTATPKYKTLVVFGQSGQDGKPEPFHLYSMRQAKEEGFILDVLENYTTYKLYFKLCKAIEDDPEINKKKAARAIGRFVSLHPHNLSQKTEIIIEHFRQVVCKRIGGKAKAMLVTGSRLHAKRYFEEFNRYIKDKGYQNNIKILVAFSGKVIDKDFPMEGFPEGVSEPQLTGMGEKELPRAFDTDEYKILIVADKYQTGFDQPLLHTMYVDKVLSGVKAVQTLSRLNRTTSGKEETFVLDFVNERETIMESFQPYYEVTGIIEEPDPNHLYDLKNRLDGFQVYDSGHIDRFARAYFDPTASQSKQAQAKLYALLDPVIELYQAIEDEDEQDAFKKGLRSWTNLYSFLSQVMPFYEVEFEKFYAFAKLLQNKLPKRNLAESFLLNDEVAMEYYRLQKIQENAIDLSEGEDGELGGATEAGLKRAKEEKAALSEIITVLNDRFNTEFEEADKLFFDQIEAALADDDSLKTQARVNPIDSFKYAFDEKFFDILIERMGQNQEIFEKILENESFGSKVKELIMKNVYSKLNEDA